MEMENFEIVLEQISQMIKNGEISALRELLTEINVVDIAQLIEELEEGEKLPVFRILPRHHDDGADIDGVACVPYLHGDVLLFRVGIKGLRDGGLGILSGAKGVFDSGS